MLRNEFNNLQAWADSFVDARNSLSAAELSTSEDPLKNDQDAQKIIQCGQFSGADVRKRYLLGRAGMSLDR